MKRLAVHRLRLAMVALLAVAGASGSARSSASIGDGTAPVYRHTVNDRALSSYDDDPYGYTRVPTYRTGSGTPAVYDRHTRLVSGRITRSTGAFGRKLRIRLDNGEERSVEAPRDVSVRRYSRPISVHELRAGEAVRIRLDRYLEEGTLIALRIDAYEGASLTPRIESGREAAIRGTVSSIDSHENILRIDYNGRRLIIHTDKAEIRAGDGVISLRDLQNGDSVTVEGRRERDEVYAIIVTVR